MIAKALGVELKIVVVTGANRVACLLTECADILIYGLTITPDKTPGILIEATWDATGEIDRVSFLAEVKSGKQVITETLPKLKK